MNAVARFLSSDENRSLTLGDSEDGSDAWFILERREGRNALYIPSLDQLLFFEGVVIRRSEKGSDVRLYFQFEGYDIGVPVDPSLSENPMEGYVSEELDGRGWITKKDVEDFSAYNVLPVDRIPDYVGHLKELGFIPEESNGDEEAAYVHHLGPVVDLVTIPAWSDDYLDVEDIYSDVDYAWACDLGSPMCGLTFGMRGGFELLIRSSRDEEGDAE